MDKTTGITPVLAAYEEALRRESHVLIAHPDLTWQQLHNRLQWKGEAVEATLAPERQRRSCAGATPWIRMATPLRESKALLRTLAGHHGSVRSCAFSPDGRWIVSASDDHTVKLWDTNTGTELRTMISHSGYQPRTHPIPGLDPDVYEAGTEDGCCAFSPDGRRIVSACGDNVLTIWDADTGAIQCTLTGHAGMVLGCAFSPDGRQVASASEGHTLKLWDADTGAEMRSLTSNTEYQGEMEDGCCAFSPDGRRSFPLAPTTY